MVNYGYQQAMERQGKVIVSLMREIDSKNEKLQEMEHKDMVIANLMREIDSKNEKLMEMEHKHKDRVARMSKLIEGLRENNNSKQKCLMDMEQKCSEFYALVRQLMDEKHELSDKCDESHHLVRQLMDEKNELSEGYQKDLQKIKDTNNLLNETVESQKKEHGELLKRLREHQLNLTKEIEKVNALRKELEEKSEEMEHVESLNRTLIIRESMCKQELYDAREESINRSQDIFRGGRSLLRIKRLGELDQKPFQNACIQKYSNNEWQEVSAQLCSSWEERLKDPHWHPFKKVIVNGVLKEIIDENDEELKGLRIEYGEKAYKAVVNALMELEEYNPNGRYAISEVWNWKEGRKASLKEIIQYIIRQLKTEMRKRKWDD
ncbi:hypothetical protein L6164_000083 [Bauhinia variegata]|uniref:Uncharacterized protein n=1 Tax=Bauhinia variegata TaxID=167791 RepID=A0ACB9QB11_BAUVA|nr:hypothetical protein L6164_000083 [Bauhinia variegata]